MTLALYLCHGFRSLSPTTAFGVHLYGLSAFSSSSYLRSRTSSARSPSPNNSHLTPRARLQASSTRLLRERRTYTQATGSRGSVEQREDDGPSLERLKPWAARHGDEALRLVRRKRSVLELKKVPRSDRNAVAKTLGRRALAQTNKTSTQRLLAKRFLTDKRRRATRTSAVKSSIWKGVLGKAGIRRGSRVTRTLRHGLDMSSRWKKPGALKMRRLVGKAQRAREDRIRSRLPIRYKLAIYQLQLRHRRRRNGGLKSLVDRQTIVMRGLANRIASDTYEPVQARTTRRPEARRQLGSRLSGREIRRPSAVRFAARLAADRDAIVGKTDQNRQNRDNRAVGYQSWRFDSAVDAILRDARGVSWKKGELYGLLRRSAYTGRTEHVTKLIDILVRRLGEQPNLKLFTALILCNVAGEGSAARIEQLLEEMKVEGLVPDTELYHAVLKALAVHPNSLLRSQIMQDMRIRWLNLTVDGWHDVAAGYLREGNVELAVEHLDDMRRARMTIQPWLSDMLIFLLCDMNEMSEVLRLLKQRCSAAPEAVSPGVWYHIFDTACSHLHHPTLNFIWNRRITLLNMNPTTGQTLAVLNSASRHGDVALATDVFRILSDRGFLFTTLHYELLMSAYMHPSIGDLKTALTITCIMAGARINITQSSLAPILCYLRTSPDQPPEALRHCKNMVQLEGRSIPTPVVNCLIEASVLQGDLESAVETYKTLHTLSPEGPDVDTFNSLFRGCHHAAQAAYSGLNEERAADRAAKRAALAAAQSAEAAEAEEKKRKAVSEAAAKVKAVTPSAAAMDVEPGTQALEFATTQLSARSSAPSSAATEPSSPNPSSIPTTPGSDHRVLKIPTRSPNRLSPLPPKHTALSLATEMVHLSIAPTALTYDRLILVCLSQDDMSDALRYYREMREMEFWPRQGTFVAMVGRLWEEWGVLERTRRGKEGRAGGSGKGREEKRWLELREVGRGLEIKDGGGEGDVAAGAVGDVHDFVEGEDGPVNRPLERAWALISVMKERKMRTDRLEALLLGELEV